MKELTFCILSANILRAPIQHADPRKQKEKEKRRLVQLIKQKKQNEMK